MAAVTENSRYFTVMGNRRVVHGNLTIATTGDTWDTGLTQIESFSTTPATAIVHGATGSGGTITFVDAADDVTAIAIGI